ncbi:MAG: DEAD/DEAH box helicase [Planctomycetaceae bacterium]|nr:DEAD/DEAH box helicase [Planctomycetaceae bacterium]
MPDVPSRDDLAGLYLDQLPFDPYPVQEEALLGWFTAKEGVLVCAPTGTGKTVIAEAALFEALHTAKRAYYTTPLIALTEQKFREMQEAAERWGFSADEVGLVTGNRRVNPNARILVVVAEILLNRLLHPDEFQFDDVAAVVMDEFHSFNDPERGAVWELSLAMLPKHVRLLLLSATVGNAVDFVLWLKRSHGRTVQLIQSTHRKVPLQFSWVGDNLLNEQLEAMADGDEELRRTPALLFCFNRSECWTVAEQLKGKAMLHEGQRKQLEAIINEQDWKTGAGTKLKPILLRGVGVHHAGMLPKYRRRVEELFQQKLLSVCVCTETLAAGINLPARSVVLTSLLKGPPLKKKLIDASSAHQMFGRAGRPQFDDQGYVYALAHPDDVKLARWKEQYDQIPEDTKDPNLIRAKKRLKKKMPKRSPTQQYWTEAQFEKLIAAPPGKLASRGAIPWRLLAYLLRISPDVERLRAFVRKRMLDEKGMELAQKRLTQMLTTLWAGGYVELDPEPTHVTRRSTSNKSENPATHDAFGAGIEESGNDEPEPPAEPESPLATGTFGALLQEALSSNDAKATSTAGHNKTNESTDDETPQREEYVPVTATPTDMLENLLVFRSVNPLYGMFLMENMALADEAERLQALESVLEVPGSVFMDVKAPGPDELPPGPLATNKLDLLLIERGLATADEIDPSKQDEDDYGRRRSRGLLLGDKLRRVFDSEFPRVADLRTSPVWVAGALLEFGGDFHKYVTSRDLAKQEGIIFRHLLRLILLCGEFSQVCPPGMNHSDWQSELNELARRVIESCRAIDPESTDKSLESMQTADPLMVDGNSELAS